MAAPTAGTAPAKPLVFRKTKREIQREREQQLALQRQQEKEADEQKQQERRNGCAKHELDQLQLLAACKSAIRLTCRSQYLQRRARTGLGLERRCPPRRRLLF
ncbi:hypothetical protein Poli38472_001818 [Pythium oligandrum]|uniref:Uncharacterized protein n=1 Tax=Pythium oligandrum TaxID=41045 RepID=A0A8K1FS49_PYTOL|nr:hypothetical protein Poli38472_001818 [Pythium oligandrum]|eukprot:TMW69662.1 hypothetical protein Poli38472_001818 [Pythium oligandrum]